MLRFRLIAHQTTSHPHLRRRCDQPTLNVMEQIIPSDILQFIQDRIDSIAQMEALLLLRESPDTWWDEARIAERLYIPVKDCRPVTTGLHRAGLFMREDTKKGRYRYRPADGDLREMVDRLAYYYAKHLVPISNLVHAKSRSRIQEFSRAFKLGAPD
jgi:hypothetical protein